MVVNPHTDRTAARAHNPRHELMWMPRPILPPLPYRLAAYTGAALGLIVIIVETLL